MDRATVQNVVGNVEQVTEQLRELAAETQATAERQAADLPPLTDPEGMAALVARFSKGLPELTNSARETLIRDYLAALLAVQVRANPDVTVTQAIETERGMSAREIAAAVDRALNQRDGSPFRRA